MSPRKPEYTTAIAMCGTCGQPHIATIGGRRHPGCVGHGSGVSHPERKGQPCRRLPVNGVTVCPTHGGSIKRIKRKAARTVAEQKAMAIVRTFGLPVDDADPGTLMLERISITAGHVRWLHLKVTTLTDAELVWGQTRDKVGGQDAGITSEAVPNVWLTLYERWAIILQKLCVDAIKIGLKEREVRIAEAQGTIICTLLDGVLTELGHNPNDPTTAATVARHLRLIS